jgi:hypothetical protein
MRSSFLEVNDASASQARLARSAGHQVNEKLGVTHGKGLAMRTVP